MNGEDKNIENSNITYIAIVSQLNVLFQTQTKKRICGERVDKQIVIRTILSILL